LAPFSYFNAVSAVVPMVMFTAGGRREWGLKDSAVNAEATGEFVASIATWELREHVNASSATVAPEIDEMAMIGLEPEPSRLVKPPRVKASPIHLECVHYRTVPLPSGPTPAEQNVMVIGRVVGVHIRDEVLTDGLVDMAKVKPIARLGYMDYTVVEKVFSMMRPD
jgi:flavin reductase (DIM6/NTAB) family NADH-FMN oxidoreductase RutF